MLADLCFHYRDQELRFTVHDSPDYYQLKLSVFNDDKRTDLIGETWIDLRDIVVQGGGQSDQWHTLSCRGKYAGEIRIETTYYDSRPKPEKPPAKLKPVASSSDLDVANGPQKTPVKRRPLPSDPVTGKAPSPSVHNDIQTPPRQKPGGPNPYAPKQSPMQPVEYNTPQPSQRFSRSQTDLHSYSQSGGNQYSTPPPRQDQYDRGDQYSPYEEQHQYQPESRPHYEVDPRRSYQNMHERYETPSPPVHHQSQLLLEADGPPPPPPAHRVRNNSGSSHEIVRRGSHDMLQNKATPPMRHDVLRSEAHRLSISSPSSAYPGRPTYRPYESAPDVQAAASHHASDQSLAAAPRHHSYDSTYDSHYRSMQPTVEDVPESWTPPKARTSISGPGQYDEMDYQLVPTTAPLHLSSRGRDVSGGHHTSPVPIPDHGRRNSEGYGSATSPSHTRDFGYPEQPPSHSYTHQNNRYIEYPSELDNNQVHSSDSYAMHLVPASRPVPATLVPGVDPVRAREMDDRLHEERRNERRYTQPAPVPAQTRGRQHSEPPTSNYSANYSPHNYQSGNSANYEQSLVTYSGPTAPSGALVLRNRGVSPNPAANHTIKRKSVSPAPPPDSRNDGRRLSGVPFGPDSYDELNPVVASVKEPDSNSQEYTNSDGKIVTADGREVDPSDHLPMESWAPEPEPKKPTASTESRSRPALSGAQPMPPSGRRPLRVTVRPQSTGGAPSQAYTTEVIPSPPASTGRNRLQKKQHRMSALPALMPSAPNPLGPATSQQRNSTPPRALVRASTFDYENYGPPSYGAPRSGRGDAPPIPAKVPMMMSSGLGPTQGYDHRGGGEDWALMEEMSRIDIGAGRSRRHITYNP